MFYSMKRTINTILRYNERSLKRKLIMEPVAHSIGIDPTSYRNKKTLRKAIIKRCSFSNECDPITLENLGDLPSERLITWEQDGSLYGADVISMRGVFESGNTINPWAIDKVSGIGCANNKEAYIKRFDMNNVEGLKESVYNRYESICNTSNPNETPETPDVPAHVVHRHAIEEVGKELYISHIIDFFESQTSKITLIMIHNALVLVMHQYAETIHIEDNTDPDASDGLYALEQLVYGVRMRLTNNELMSLEIASEILNQCNQVLNTTTIERIFDALDKQIKDLVP